MYIHSIISYCRVQIKPCWTNFTRSMETTETIWSPSLTSTSHLVSITSLELSSTTPGTSWRRIVTRSVLTCYNWSTCQRINFSKTCSVRIWTWVQRRGRELPLCHHNSRNPWNHWWKPWVSVIPSLSDVSSQMNTRSQWWVLYIHGERFSDSTDLNDHVPSQQILLYQDDSCVSSHNCVWLLPTSNKIVADKRRRKMNEIACCCLWLEYSPPCLI